MFKANENFPTVILSSYKVMHLTLIVNNPGKVCNILRKQKKWADYAIPDSSSSPQNGAAAIAVHAIEDDLLDVADINQNTSSNEHFKQTQLSNRMGQISYGTINDSAGAALLAPPFNMN